jgi:hypothetical protein
MPTQNFVGTLTPLSWGGSGTMTFNVLDYYEKGTWVPVLSRVTSVSAHTYTLQTG